MFSSFTSLNSVLFWIQTSYWECTVQHRLSCIACFHIRYISRHEYNMILDDHLLPEVLTNHNITEFCWIVITGFVYTSTTAVVVVYLLYVRPVRALFTILNTAHPIVLRANINHPYLKSQGIHFCYNDLNLVKCCSSFDIKQDPDLFRFMVAFLVYFVY